MKHYYTYRNSFKHKSKITNTERYLLTGGDKGQAENHLTENSDRITRLIEYSPWSSEKKINIEAIKTLTKWCKEHLEKIGFYDKGANHFYTRFEIPKATGGKRVIEAPEEFLKGVQRTLVNTLKEHLHLLEHNNAHAYVEGKGTQTNAEYHRKSNHFAKVDFSNFFPGITSLYLKEILPKIGFFSNIFIPAHRDALQNLLDLIIDASTLRDGLPQGAVTSPFLSNLVMIPFDYHMIKYLRKNHPNIIYTRYADDMQFSSYYAFADRKEDAKILIESIIQKIIDEHYNIDNKPMLKINPKKTLITTKYGKNRVTGIKINKDNKLSIGYKEKREIKQNLANLIIKEKSGEPIDEDVKNETLGMFSYLHSIEPDYAKYIESRLLQKFNIPHKTIRAFLGKKH